MMMKNKSFAIFILTYKRPNEQITLETLRRQGYTGDIYAIVDNTDDTIEELKKQCKDSFKDIIIFDKKEYYDKTDTMDNFNNLKSVLYARNACIDIAEKMKLKNFMMIDDDVKQIVFRYEQDGKLKAKEIKNLDGVLDAIIDFENSNDIISCLGVGNAGSYIGGLEGRYKKGLELPVYCIFILKGENNIRFTGTSNEDETWWIKNCQLGKQTYAILKIAQNTFERGQNDGGLKEMYEEIGTYMRNFYSLIAYPSQFVLEFKDGEFKSRKNNNAISPKLLNERWKR